MPRILILIILVYLLYIVGKRFIALIQTHQAKKAAQNASFKHKNSAEKVVKCALCGTHVPESETMLSNEQRICKQPCKP
jgi:formylmethanofuran dehydrogenase subunit E